jgi:hypothetical protein
MTLANTTYEFLEDGAEAIVILYYRMFNLKVDR